ncbi:DinB family protein [Streptomyces sp. NPDC001941]|uniref:DinB family protein n=1 Tax=Streptomyces sp. NPDC001941 TaxID=3154659 RepID=UPI003333E247
MATVVPYEGSEKESLRASLTRHCEAVAWKLEGLGEEQARRVLVPSGTNPVGLVKHLASVHYGWLVSTFGREVEPLWFDPFTDEDSYAFEDETVESVLAFYGRARAAADRTIEELDLDATGTAWHGATVSLRWALIRMVEETARHAGHLDILRELIDGRTGDHQR